MTNENEGPRLLTLCQLRLQYVLFKLPSYLLHEHDVMLGHTIHYSEETW
jgi:hypothetical protein